MTFEQRPHRGEGVSYANIWKDVISRSGNSKCKGPKVGECLACSKKDREASVVGAERIREN